MRKIASLLLLLLLLLSSCGKTAEAKALELQEGTSYACSVEELLLSVDEFCGLQSADAGYTLYTEGYSCLLSPDFLLSAWQKDDHAPSSNEMCRYSMEGDDYRLYKDGRLEKNGERFLFDLPEQYRVCGFWEYRGGLNLVAEEISEDYQPSVVLLSLQEDKVKEAKHKGLWEFYQKADHLYLYGPTLSIVEEEAKGYFEGFITAEKAAEFIQNRVQIYLDEQG